MKIKKILVIIGFLFLVACETIGGKQSGELIAPIIEINPDEPAFLRLADDQHTIQWYINFSWFTNPTGTAVHRRIQEDTGINIDFMVPVGNEIEQLYTMIATNTLPDIITLAWNEPIIAELIDAGMVHPINLLADNFDPYFWNVVNPERISWYTAPNGNVYQIPNQSFSHRDYDYYEVSSNVVFVVRRDMWEALGQPNMSTPEGFIQAFRDAREMFPTVDGLPLIPLGLDSFTRVGNRSLQHWLMSFLAIPFVDDQGQLIDREQHPEYVRWLKVFRQLAEEGLLTDDVFIDQRVQMDEKIAQGRYFAMIYQRTDFQTQQMALYAQDPNMIYFAIHGPKNSAGDPHRLPGPTIHGWTVTMITTNATDPERAISLMTYFLREEGQWLTSLGPEGIAFDVVDGRPVEREEIRNMRRYQLERHGREIGGNNLFWMLMDSAMQTAWMETPPPPLDQMHSFTIPYTVNDSEFEFMLPFDSEEFLIVERIAQLFGSTLPQLILAPTEEVFNEIWANYIEQKYEMGYDRVMKLYREQHRNNRERLGLGNTD